MKTESQVLIEKLQEKGIRPSVQRMAIYTWLWDNPVHPTVDQVYSALNGQYPTLSKTTVYNTLHLFSQQQIIQEVKIEDEEVRYDANTKPHLHFKCTECGRVFDVFMDDDLMRFNGECRASLLPGFQLSRVETNLWGKCSWCSSKKPV